MSVSSVVPNRGMLVDVVDANDRVIGTARRADLLGRATGFRVAHILVFNAHGDLLLQQLADSRERHPLRWGSSVAAYVFSGETYSAAAARRLQQELGVIDAPTSIGRVSMTDEGCIKWIGVFRLESDGPFTPDPGHIRALRFISLTGLTHELRDQPQAFTPTFRHIAAALLQIP